MLATLGDPLDGLVCLIDVPCDTVESAGALHDFGGKFRHRDQDTCHFLCQLVKAAGQDPEFIGDRLVSPVLEIAVRRIADQFGDRYHRVYEPARHDDDDQDCEYDRGDDDDDRDDSRAVHGGHCR